jgi:hypothetical protein
MSPTVDMFEHMMPTIEEIETDLDNWKRRIASWAERIPWAVPDQRDLAMSTAKFLRQIVAESWIHLIACKARGSDPMDDSAFRSRRLHRQLLTYGPSLALKMEERLPESVPNLAA